MAFKIKPSNTPILHKIPTDKTPHFYSSFPSKLHRRTHPTNSASPPNQSSEEPPYTLTQTPPQDPGGLQSTLKFQTLKACRLGIARYPDFEYNAEGGIGTAVVKKRDVITDGETPVSFDVETLYIPPLTGATTRFLGLPLPPFLKIDIVPEVFKGTINKESRKVDLRFRAKFWFSVGRIYRAPPLVVETTLTSEESKGTMRSGKGERMDGEGRCRLVGVATVQPINDVLMDSFLGLPTECIAELNARISFSGLS